MRRASIMSAAGRLPFEHRFVLRKGRLGGVAFYSAAITFACALRLTTSGR
jgi:hypothetical protein